MFDYSTQQTVSKLRVVSLRETDFLIVAELKAEANPWHQVASVIQWQSAGALGTALCPDSSYSGGQ